MRQQGGHAPIAVDEATSPARHWFRSGAVVAISLMLMTLAGAAVLLNGGDRVAAAPLDPTCEPWDAAAGAAVVRLLNDRSDVSVRRASDAVFRLRRARRNCRAGWVHLACEDYHSLLTSTAIVDDRYRAPAPVAACLTAMAALTK